MSRARAAAALPGVIGGPGSAFITRSTRFRRPSPRSPRRNRRTRATRPAGSAADRDRRARHRGWHRPWRAARQQRVERDVGAQCRARPAHDRAAVRGRFPPPRRRAVVCRHLPHSCPSIFGRGSAGSGWFADIRTRFLRELSGCYGDAGTRGARILNFDNGLAWLMVAGRCRR
jgi:hypothetical protein